MTEMNPDVLHLTTGLVSCALSVNLNPGTVDDAKLLTDEIFAAAERSLTGADRQDFEVLLASMVAGLIQTFEPADPSAYWLEMVSEMFAEFGVAHLDPNLDIDLTI